MTGGAWHTSPARQWARTSKRPPRPSDMELWSADELATDQRDAGAVRPAAHAGLWPGEMLALRAGDIDSTGSLLTISRTTSVGVEWGAKSGRSR